MAKGTPIHPGKVLEDKFLDENKITAYRLAKETGMQQTRISQILKKKRSISADTALRLSKFFGTAPKFWLDLQNEYDLSVESKKSAKEIAAIPNYKKIK